MPVPLQISFRNIGPSDAIEADIRKHVDRLQRFHGRITNCRVVIDARHRNHHKGVLYNCGIDISIPGMEVAVHRVGPQDHAHEDVYVAIRDAFNAAGRRLEDRVRRARLDVKTHALPTPD
jgi:ribosomal subunit interface protein